MSLLCSDSRLRWCGFASIETNWRPLEAARIGANNISRKIAKAHYRVIQRESGDVYVSIFTLLFFPTVKCLFGRYVARPSAAIRRSNPFFVARNIQLQMNRVLHNP